MEQKTHYLYGIHSVMEALESNKRIEKVLFKQGLEGVQFRQLVKKLQEREIPLQFAPAERLNSITNGNHQGVIAFISQVDYIPIEEMVENALGKSKNPLFILLDGVSDVRNFGAIARSAECAGVAGIILPAKGGAAVNADAIKTSAGALLRVATSKAANLRVAVYYLLESGFQIIAADEKAGKSIYEIDFRKPTAIIMGSENKGISDLVLSLATDKAKIPLMGAIGSLNVSIAASIIMFEAVRQKNV
ncbi:MAG: 23S rRNA (guanosine(2251)-2'-O)-methyltransferase RlmB [Rikenellaceae bacterium]